MEPLPMNPEARIPTGRPPKLSILLATKDQSSTLEKCLQGIGNQTFKEYELLILDDGSKDGTPQILDRWAKLDPRIRLFRNPTAHGVIPAYQKLQNLAVGEFIWHAASDDFCIDPNFLTNGFRLLATSPQAAGFFCNTLRVMLPSEKPHGIWGSSGKEKYLPPKIFIKRFLSGRIVTPGCATVLRRILFLSLGGFLSEAGALCDLLAVALAGGQGGMIFTGTLSMMSGTYQDKANFGSSFDPWRQLESLAFVEISLRTKYGIDSFEEKHLKTFRYLYLGKFFGIEHRYRQAKKCPKALQELTSMASKIIETYKTRILLSFSGQDHHFNKKELLRFPFEKRFLRKIQRLFDRQRYGFEVSL
jgi:glycosyltransferase involved in cell wall biosynthesis